MVLVRMQEERAQETKRFLQRKGGRQENEGGWDVS